MHAPWGWRGWLWAGGSGRRSALGRRSCAPQSPRETERQTDRRQRGAGDHPIQVAWLLGEHERLAEARANAAMEELLAEEAAAAAAQQQQQQQPPIPPPIPWSPPSTLILDFSLVYGMDGSASELVLAVLQAGVTPFVTPAVTTVVTTVVTTSLMRRDHMAPSSSLSSPCSRHPPRRAHLTCVV